MRYIRFNHGVCDNMLLSEIAEWIISQKPNCCMAINNEVIKGKRDKEYEESLIKPVMDYWMFEDLEICGCGYPECTYEVIRNYLQIIHDYGEPTTNIKSIKDGYLTKLHISFDDDMQLGLLQFMAYILDEHEFIKHGSSIVFPWLTDKGRMLLSTLNIWYDHENNEDICKTK